GQSRRPGPFHQAGFRGSRHHPQRGAQVRPLDGHHAGAEGARGLTPPIVATIRASRAPKPSLVATIRASRAPKASLVATIRASRAPKASLVATIRASRAPKPWLVATIRLTTPIHWGVPAYAGGYTTFITPTACHCPTTAAARTF